VPGYEWLPAGFAMMRTWPQASQRKWSTASVRVIIVMGASVTRQAGHIGRGNRSAWRRSDFGTSIIRPTSVTVR